MRRSALAATAVAASAAKHAPDGFLVAIPPSRSIPQKGNVVEARYLYAFRQSGAIYQPVCPGPRDDVLVEK